MKPILFNTEMVRALLNNQKTVTRRVVRPQHLRVLNSPYRKEHPETPDGVLLEKLCEPPYRPGDILYVRETFFKYAGEYVYKASAAQPELWNGMWRPSIHMPREAARIFLRVSNVRVKKLQDITDKEIVAEGIRQGSYPEKGTMKWRRYQLIDYANLWNSTIKPADLAFYGWDANPWVWVIEFERIEKSKIEGRLGLEAE